MKVRFFRILCMQLFEMRYKNRMEMNDFEK